LNEIDWKSGLSPKTDRLAQHLCAFSNQEGGGSLVYGVNTPPKSRNEKIAILMHLFDLCELRGSGVDRAIEAVEKAILPAPKFIKGDFYTKVVIYPKKTFAQMTREDRIRACYQHCCLKYMDNEQMTNQSFRERMGIEEKNYPMALKIIRETLNSGLIKGYSPDNIVRKMTSYIPYWG
jgi:predicted HTH transcriptional regulator